MIWCFQQAVAWKTILEDFCRLSVLAPPRQWIRSILCFCTSYKAIVLCLHKSEAWFLHAGVQGCIGPNSFPDPDCRWWENRCNSPIGITPRLEKTWGSSIKSSGAEKSWRRGLTWQVSRSRLVPFACCLICGKTSVCHMDSESLLHSCSLIAANTRLERADAKCTA